MSFRLREPHHIQPGSWVRMSDYHIRTLPSTHTHERINWINAVCVSIAWFELRKTNSQWSNLWGSYSMQLTWSPSSTSAVLLWYSFNGVSHYCNYPPLSCLFVKLSHENHTELILRSYQKRRTLCTFIVTWRRQWFGAGWGCGAVFFLSTASSQVASQSTQEQSPCPSGRTKPCNWLLPHLSVR